MKGVMMRHLGIILTLSLLLGGCADIQTELNDAAAKGDVSAVEALLDKGADVNARDKDDWTPLHFAAFVGHNDVVALLLDKGADLNAMEAKHDWTPLHFAALRGHKDVVALLVAKGANVKAKGKDGNRPIDVARTKETQDLLK